MRYVLSLFVVLFSPSLLMASPAPIPTASETAGIDPAVVQLLDKSAASYKALSGFSMEASESHESEGKVVNYAAHVEFSRPYRVRYELSFQGEKMIYVASDGEMSSQYDLREYSVQQLKKEKALSMVLNLTGTLQLPLTTLAMGKNPLNPLDDHLHLKDARLVDASTIKLVIANEVATLDFDAGTNLLRRIEISMNGESYIADITETKRNPDFATGTFNYTPPPGAKLLKDPESVYADPKLTVGKAPYALQAKTIQGKTPNLKDYLGKVVLLDFWATWCRPCVRELPNVLKAYQKYHSKGFEVIGISLDFDKKRLADFIKTRGIKYNITFDGKAWKNADAVRFGVEAVPSTLLIGRDGKIAALNPRGELLEPAILKALSSK